MIATSGTSQFFFKTGGGACSYGPTLILGPMTFNLGEALGRGLLPIMMNLSKFPFLISVTTIYRKPL